MVTNDGRGAEVRITPAAIGAFLCLLSLCYQAHELGHHLFGGVVCGRLGTVSLSTFTIADGCARVADLATELFGPAISLAIAYGAADRLRHRPSLLAFGFVFASYYHLRWVPPLMGGGDELDVARKLGFDHAWVISALVFLIGLPPIVIAWRAATARGRWWRVALAYFLPLPILLEVDMLAARVSGPGAFIPSLARVEILNIPVSLLVVDFAFAAGFTILGRRVLRRSA